MDNLFLLIWIYSVLTDHAPFMVEGNSMEPTLLSEQIFLIDKDLSVPQDISRGDVIVFSNGDDYFYVKRVIGMPGESLKLEDESVQIKDQDGVFRPFEEPYVKEVFDYGDERFFIVPENEYFVMGDNRGQSRDSRFFEDPYIDESMIYGKYIWP